MLAITKDKLIPSLFAKIQQNKLEKGEYHYGSGSKWCISGDEIEQAIEDIFAETDIFKATVDCIEIQQLLNVCNDSAETVRGIMNKCLDNIGKGESTESAFGAVAYFAQQERIYRYEIPNIINEVVGAEI